ncbi:MAG: TrmH family RNA methyltransferase [Actinocatenispora sp.]
MPRQLRITTRNAQFQQWLALLSNRTKRQRTGEFLVQGVRPITLAVEHGWSVRALVHPAGTRRSAWAEDLLDRHPGAAVAMAPDLVRELGGKTDEAPEILAVIGLPEDRLDRIPRRADMLVTVFDRPTSPGNIGTLIRSADAFGASGVIITGHAADPYDPKAVRASTGSLFAVPTVRCGSHREVVDWVADLRAGGIDITVLGTDEHGDVDVADQDLCRPTLALLGNETNGLSAAWRDTADRMVRIPMTGSASSLNAANAATVLLYEAARQRRART